MKKTLLASILAMAAISAAAQVPAEYKVAPWHGFSRCAITYSFDDLCANQLPIAIPILDKYNVKASLNVVTDWVKPEEWASVREAGIRGHEIASHTVSHPNLTEKSVEEFEREQSESKRILEEKTGLEVVTMVYPYCKTTHEDITAKYYIGARICDERIEPHTPKEMMKISSRGVGPMFNFNSAEAFNKWVDQGAEAGGWCTFLIHGIDGDGGYSAIKSSDLEEHVKYVSGKPKDFWPATCAQVCKYIMERDALQITELPAKKGYKISVKCNASSSIAKLDEPVTISRQLPNSWKSVIIYENGKAKAPLAMSKDYQKGNKATTTTVILDVVPGNTYEIRKK